MTRNKNRIYGFYFEQNYTQIIFLVFQANNIMSEQGTNPILTFLIILNGS